MPVWLLKYLPHLIVAAIVATAVWSFSNARYSAGEAAGAAQVRAEWDAEKRAIAAENARLEEEKVAKEKSDQAAAKEIQDALQQKLDSADSRARDLARRLSVYQARDRQRGLPADAGPASGPDSAAGEPGSDGAIGQATEEAFGACARDAERLAGWQEWWARVGDR